MSTLPFAAVIALWIGLSQATALPLTFEFRTTVDTTEVGGGHGTPLSVIYTFDSKAEDVSGGLNPNFAIYGLSHIRINIGSESVEFPGGAIEVLDGREDSYGVSTTGFSGQMFGLTPVYFQFLLVNKEADMFNSIDLPISPAFALAVDFQQTYMSLDDGTTGGLPLVRTFEFEDTQPQDAVPISLAQISGHLIPEPSTWMLASMGLSVVSIFHRCARNRLS